MIRFSGICAVTFLYLDKFIFTFAARTSRVSSASVASISPPYCQPGVACHDYAAKCCIGNTTYYCVGDDSSLAWQLAPGETCTICEKPCFSFWDPRCGTDGITYQNQCYLENAICRKSNLKLSHEGECIGPGACRLGCGDGFQLSYGAVSGVTGAYAVSACGQPAACVPSLSNCAKACPYGYYLCAGYDTTCLQHSACGETIWCKPQPLMPSQCNGVMCANSGIMTYTSTSCICTCLEGYYGQTCNYRYADNCQGLSCANNALIVADASGCRCGCGGGYSGSYCQDVAAYNTCGNTVCHNGGVLSRGAQGCTCTCLNGFFGTTCNAHPDCPNLQCQNGGFVTRTNFRCECACPFGFYGAQCEFEHYGEWVTIKSRFYDLCISYGIDGNAFLEECEFGKSSQTFLVKTNFIITWDERCLEIEGPGRTGNVAVHPCHYMTSQYWAIQEPAIKTFDKLCLDVEGGIFQGGRNLIVWDCHQNENQAWQLQPSFPPTHGAGCPPFLCEVDPCAVFRCQLFPQATCEPDYCFCTARFQINGNEVRCDPIKFPDPSPYFTRTV
eukprot:EG_transcript_7786